MQEKAKVVRADCVYTLHYFLNIYYVYNTIVAKFLASIPNLITIVQTEKRFFGLTHTLYTLLSCR